MKKKRTEACLEVIKGALRHWDPIGVIDLLVEDGLPDNEYDSYAPGVLSLLEKGKNAEGISNHLAQLRKVSMELGNDRPTEREQELGEKLVAWRDDGYGEKPDFRFTRYAF